MSEVFETAADVTHNTDHTHPSEKHVTESASTPHVMPRVGCADLTIQSASQNAATFSKLVDCHQSPSDEIYTAKTMLQWFDMDMSPIPESFYQLQGNHNFRQIDVSATSQTSLV